jgi:hypothetical protein
LSLIKVVYSFLAKNELAQGCQIFLGTWYQNRKNVPNKHRMYQMVKNIPNVCKIFQIAIKYINIFQSRALQNWPKLGFLVWKETIWQSWLGYILADLFTSSSCHPVMSAVVVAFGSSVAKWSTNANRARVWLSYGKNSTANNWREKMDPLRLLRQTSTYLHFQVGTAAQSSILRRRPVWKKRFQSRKVFTWCCQFSIQKRIK